jgi:hypothetical protein
MIEYWHVIAVLVGVACNVILLFMYFRSLRKARFKSQETVKLLSTFYKALAVVCFLPIVSPAYWISADSLFWDIVQPFLNGLHGGAFFAMWFFFFACFSLVFCLLCVAVASWLPSERGKKLGLFVSALFTIISISSLWSLYNDLLWAVSDPHYYWISYLLYMLANVSLAITNAFSFYYLVALKHQMVSNATKARGVCVGDKTLPQPTKS